MDVALDDRHQGDDRHAAHFLFAFGVTAGSAFRPNALRRAAQYVRIRSATACLAAAVQRPLAFRVTVGNLGAARLAGFRAGGRVVGGSPGLGAATLVAAGLGRDERLGVSIGAISIPNISERSSPVSTFAPPASVPFCARPVPAVAIKSC